MSIGKGKMKKQTPQYPIMKYRHLPWIMLLAFTLIPGIPRISHAELLVNEIMYNPSGPEHACEYIELYNTGPGAVLLWNWRIGDGTATDTLILPQNGNSYYCAEGQYVLILDPDYWTDGEGAYDDRVPEQTLILTVPGHSLGSGGLANSTSETVELIDPTGRVQSSRTYLPDAPPGVSEERILFSGGNGDDNWAFSSVGGSPGSENTVTPERVHLEIDSLELSLQRSGESAAYDLAVNCRIVNTGLEPSFPCSLVVTVTRHLVLGENDLTLAPVPSLTPGASYPIQALLEDMPAGRARLTFDLESQGGSQSADTISSQLAVPYEIASVRINEIMPYPPVDLDIEWVELWIPDNRFLPLGGWMLTDGAGRSTVIDSLHSWRQLEAYPHVESYFILTGDSTLLTALPEQSERIVVSPGFPILNNDEDTLRLYDPTGLLVDWTAYSDPAQGISLNRTESSPGYGSNQWRNSSSADSASPGMENSINSRAVMRTSASVRISPNPFAPMGSGSDSETTFHFSFPADQVTITLKLFDIQGRLLATLLSGSVFPGDSEWTWDGKQGLGYSLPLGIYIYHVDARSSNSAQKWRLKGSLVSAGSGG